MSTLRTKMIELLKKDRKREYLNLCTQNYAEAVSIAQELFPEHYEKAGTGMDPFDSLYGEALKTKEQGNMEEEIRILETAVQSGSAMPYCYERLVILYSKQKIISGHMKFVRSGLMLFFGSYLMRQPVAYICLIVWKN